MINSYSKHILPVILFAVLATVLVSSWFRAGLLYGGGDVGIPSYDPQRILDIARFVWWEAGAPGNLVPHGVTSLPMQLFQSALVEAGLPYFAVQATLFWILLFLTGFGMFLVGVSVFGKDKLHLPILCGLFYLLNSYMMIQVWHRFIHNTFFLAAFLPFFYLFWDGWIKKGKLISLLLFLLANVLGVYLYGTIAFVVTIVFVLSFIFLKNLIPWQGIGLFKKISFRFVSGLLFWVLIHAWWILPTFNITPALFTSQHRTFDSLTTLIVLSRQTAIPYILSGINPFYLFEQADFGEIYKQPVFLTIMFLPLFFLIPGFIAALRSKALFWWGMLLVAAGFLAKGAAAPFGFIYIFALTNFFVLGVLRNPFEKMGILLPFSGALIMTAGVNWYLERFSGKQAKLTKILVGVLLFLQMGVFLWPFWSGKLIGKYNKLALVAVPEYYQKADDFIKQQQKTGKILHLPLTPGESITYSWPNAFSGIESSQLIFQSLPSISRGLNIKHVDDSIIAASNIFRKNPNDAGIIALLQDLNVRFIVLHKDVVWQGGYLDDPVKLQGLLDNKGFLDKKGNFGELVVYEIVEKYFKPRIYTSSSVNLLSRGEKNTYWPYLLSENYADFISVVNQADLPVNPLQTIVIPTKTWSFRPQNASLEEAIKELLAASKILPGSKLYPLIKLKEDLRIVTSFGPEKIKMKFNLLGKRLVEAVRLKEGGKGTKEVINTYSRSLAGLNADNFKDQIDFIGGRKFVKEAFIKHLAILDTLLEKTDSAENEDIRQAKDELLAVMKKSEFIPKYNIQPILSSEDSEYRVYQFQVPSQGEYELLMADAKTRSVYQNRLENLNFLIDGNKQKLQGTPANEFMSYGKIKLDKGEREFTLTATSSNNLFDFSDNEIRLSSAKKSSSFFEAGITPLTADTWYAVRFEAWIKSGNKFKLQLVADGNVEYEKSFTKDTATIGWNKYKEDILFNKPAATNATIRFLVEPSYNEEETQVAFRNIKVERLLDNPIFLRSTNSAQFEANQEPGVEFTQRSPVYYSGKIKLGKGAFIIFSETFHPDWRLKLSNSQGSFEPKRRFLANMYANAWLVPEAGEYNFELEFTPQRTFNTGLMVSSATLLSLVVFYLTKKWLR